MRRNKVGIPLEGAATLALTGDLKQMDPYWLRGASMLGYGVSFMLGVGVPIPLLNEDIVRRTAIRDRDIQARIYDYSSDYPRGKNRVIGRVNYEQLRGGEIRIKGKKIPTASLSSYARAREIAGILKDWIRAGDFTLTEPVAPLPGADSGYACHNLPLRGFKKQIQKPF